MLSSTTQEHIHNCALDSSAVGARIGSGAGHIVYKYGEHSVIKIPRFRWAKHNLSIITAADAQRNVEHIQRYFREYVPETTIYKSQKTQSYCIVQSILSSYENLTLDHIQRHPDLARQFADILQRNQQLIRTEGLSVDFFGKEGSIKTILAFLRLQKPQMANILVVPEKELRLYIADSQLFEIRKPENAQLSRRMMAEASRWGFEINRVFAKGGFGQDLKK